LRYGWVGAAVYRRIRSENAGGIRFRLHDKSNVIHRWEVSMNAIRTRTRFSMNFALLSAVLLLAMTGAALAHGPGGHGDASFTALQALDRGVTLYDKLLASGKLEESWETGLNRVDIEMRGKEYVVSFSRSKGDPERLFIFFDGTGEYTGSNFTGE
jgi:hypothetical protein